MRASHPRLAFGALLALLALSPGCGDSPTGPKPLGPGILAPGALVTGTITSRSDTARYDLNLSEGKDVVIYFMVKGPLLRLEVHDSLGSPVTATADAHNPGLPERRFTTIIPSTKRHYRVDVSSVAGDSASDYEIRVVAASRAPEHVPAALDIGHVVTGEDLGHATDVDSFSVSPTTTQLVSLYARKTKPGPATIFVRASNPNEYYPTTVLVGAADTVLGASASVPFSMQAGSHWTIQVSYGTPPDSGATPYELEVRPIDPAPESGPAAIVPNDTITESIDYPRDFDVFTVTGTPGAQVNVFVQALGSAPHAVNAYVESATIAYASVTAFPGHALGDTASVVFSLPADGKAKVTVSEYSPSGAPNTGAYRLLVYQVDPRPEGVPAALALDQTTTSQLDPIGDVDEFTLTIPRDTIVNVVVRAIATVGHPLGFTLRDARDSVLAERWLGGGTYPYADVDSGGLGSRLLVAGTYKVRVIDGNTTSGGYLGRYEILPRTVNSAPETHSATITPGDTVRGESIDPAGDVDRYHMTLAAGDSVFFGIGPTAATFRLNVTLSTSQWDFPDRLFVAPRAGDYYIDVRGNSAGADLTERIPYELHTGRVGLAPEDRSPAFSLGDTVRSRIDVSGEADEFLTTAPAGATLTGSISWSGSGAPDVWAVFIDPATGAHLDSALAVHASVGQVIVPASGALRVRIVGLAPCGGYTPCLEVGPTGPYSFSLHALNRGPETGSAAYTVGDTVSEAIYPGDIDEYHFDGVAGDTVSVYFQLPSEPTGYGGLSISLIDLTTGATLGTISNSYASVNLEDVRIPNVVLPSTGSYQVRVEGTSEFDGAGPYRFKVAR